MPIMKDTPEMRSAAYKEAINRKAQVTLHGIVPGMTQEDLDDKIIAMAQAKADITGKSLASLVGGQEWYVNELIEFAGMTAEERYEWGRSQSFADTASDNELLDALAD